MVERRNSAGSPLVRRLTLIGLTLMCVAIPRAQQAPQVPTFRGGVDLVTVDVTVLDRDGKPVAGLDADDFEIKLDGKVQPVRVVTFIQATGGPAPEAPEVPAPGTVTLGARQVYTNEEPPKTEARVIVFMVDDLSFSFSRGKELFVAAEKFIKNLPDRDLVGFTTSSGSVAINPTTDHAAVLEAMQRAVGQYLDPRTISPGGMSGGKDPNAIDAPDSAVGLQQALAIERGDNNTLVDVVANECFNGDRSAVEAQSIQAMAADNECISAVLQMIRRTVMLTRTNTARQAGSVQAIIEAMKPATGMKQLVLFTDGLALDIDVGVVKPVALAAADAGVRITVMAPEPDLNISDTGRRSPSVYATSETMTRQQSDTGLFRRRIEDSRMLLNGAETTAEMLGGQFYRVIGDPDPFMERAALAASAVYRLGVQAPKDTEFGKDFRLDVKVDRKDVNVFANRHAVVSAPDANANATPPPSADELLRRAVGAGQSLYGVPLKVGTSLRRSPKRPDGSAPPAPLELAVNVEVPSTVTGPLKTMFGLVNDADRNGQMTSGQRPVPSPPMGQPFLISFSLPVSDGAYHLRFAAADSEGAVGAIEIPVKAELATMGPFKASDVLTAWVDAQGRPQLFTLDELPKAATSLQASVEFYPTSGTLPEAYVMGDEVFVQWTLTKEGDAEPVDDREVIAERVDQSLRATTEFLFDGLGAGTFTIRGKVRFGETELGTVQTTIRVPS